MQRISKQDIRIYRTAYGAMALWMSLPFIGLGGYFALAGFGAIPLPGKANAPLWIIGCIGLVFFLAGATLLFHALRGLAHKHRAERLRQRNAPVWQIDYPWDAGGVRDHGRAGTANGWFGVVLLGLFLVPFNWWAFFSRDGSLAVQLITGLFDLLWLALLIHSLYRSLQGLKFRRSQLAFEHFPFAPGEPLQVWLSPCPPGELQATLRFVEERFEQRGSGRNRSAHHVAYAHWSETRQLDVPRNAHALPIRFELPDRAEWQTQLSADPAIRYWELLIESRAPGINYRATFPLPVYQHPRSQRIGKPWPPVRRRSGYGFELKLAVVIFLLLAVPYVLWPDASWRLLHSARQQASGLWLGLRHGPVDIGSSSVMQLQASDGQLWALSKYQLVRFADGDAFETVFDNHRARQQLNKRGKSWSAFYRADDGRLFIGGWYGQVLAGNNGSWRELAADKQPINGRIYALTEHRGQLLAASRSGLWRYADNHWQRIESLGSQSVLAFGKRSGQLYALAHNGLWLNNGARWQRIWRASIDYGRPQTLARSDDGWLIGTGKGLLLLPDNGIAEWRLRGLPVIGVAVAAGRLFVSSRKRGLFVARLDSEQARPITLGGEPNLSQLLVSNDRLWMVDYGGGVWRLPLTAIGNSEE